MGKPLLSSLKGRLKAGDPLRSKGIVALNELRPGTSWLLIDITVGHVDVPW